MQAISNKKAVFQAASYTRLSHEDEKIHSARAESNSITNQKAFIRSFVKNMPEIEIAAEFQDDGYSGVDFNRPAFVEMIAAAKAGAINCIIVKDLSRLGRNYIEAGRYMEQIFPSLNIRFISINENYDSFGTENLSLTVPFLNLINDAYCRDISVKTRSSLLTKKKKGEFTGSFTPYGYKRDPHNPHQLVIDTEAALIVTRIFNMRMDGISGYHIAKILNAEKIPTPAEYKQSQGINYISGSQKGLKASWANTSILRILTNRVYLGILEQGKYSTINYKVRKNTKKKPADWICIEAAHEPLIDKNTFEMVQKILRTDNRTAPHHEKEYLFSGLVVCGSCGKYMTRRKMVRAGKEYIYYGCYKKNKTLFCPKHNIREELLYGCVQKSIQLHLSILADMDHLFQSIEKRPMNTQKLKSFQQIVQSYHKDLERYQLLKVKLFEDMHDGFISRAEYNDIKSVYDLKCSDIEIYLNELKKQVTICQNDFIDKSFIAGLKKYVSAKTLTKRMLCIMIDKILVYANNELKISFHYDDEFSE